MKTIWKIEQISKSKPLIIVAIFLLIYLLGGFLIGFFSMTMWSIVLAAVVGIYKKLLENRY